jgi:hypothetical protein
VLGAGCGVAGVGEVLGGAGVASGGASAPTLLVMLWTAGDGAGVPVKEPEPGAGFALVAESP